MAKGLFGAAIVLFLLFPTLLLASQRAKIESEQAFSQAHAIEAEKASFILFQTERNIDFIVEKTLEEELSSKNFDPQLIKEKIAQKIQNYAQLHPKEEDGIKVEFFIENTTGKIPSEPHTLSELMQVIVVSGKNIVAAEFTFTGGPNKDSLFKATIFGKHFSTEFMIPPGYSAKKAVVVT